MDRAVFPQTDHELTGVFAAANIFPAKSLYLASNAFTFWMAFRMSEGHPKRKRIGSQIQRLCRKDVRGCKNSCQFVIGLRKYGAIHPRSPLTLGKTWAK